MRFQFTKKRVVLAVLIFLSLGLTVLTASGRDGGIITNALSFIIVPAQNAVTTSTNYIAGFFGNIGDVNRLIRENERLSLEIEGLLLDLSRLELLESENLELTALLDMSQRYPRFDFIGASIISRNNNNWHTSFSVDRGRNHGVTQNMVAVAGGSLVGRVSVTSDLSSHITPIVDDTSTVGAITSRGAFGFVRGDLTLSSDGLLRFELDAGADIIEGDEVLTSSYGTIYPPGIPIGTIVSINETVGATPGIVAFVEPLVDFRNLNNVLIITNEIES